MKLKSIFKISSVVLATIAITPVVISTTSCAGNGGQSYSSLVAKGSFTINSNADASNIKSVSLKHLSIYPASQIDSSAIQPISNDSCFWEFLYALGSNYNTIGNVNYDASEATPKISFSKAGQTQLNWVTSASISVCIVKEHKVYIDSSKMFTSIDKLPDCLKSFVSQIYSACTVK
nr:hypothetical protein PlMoll_1540 [uncultured Mycoplasmataceae bacterium]